MNCLTLTMEDFDFEKNTVRINKSYQRLQGQDVITTPKTPRATEQSSCRSSLREIQEYFAMLYDQILNRQDFSGNKELSSS